jgi:hypothetical protein
MKGNGATVHPSEGAPTLVPQAHGGALLTGGLPGNAGGRPPSALREAMRTALSARLGVLQDIADGRAIRRVKVGAEGEETELWVSPDPGDRIRALDVLAKYGLGAATDVTVDQVRERLGRTVEVIRRRLPAELSAAILNEMRTIWLT